MADIYKTTHLVNGASVTQLVVDDETITWSTAPERYFWIDLGPFQDRFGEDWPVIASSTDRECIAFMNAVINNRKYINLKDPRVANAVDLLIATSKPTTWSLFPTSGPMTPAKKAVIMNPMTTEYERHVKGLPQPVGE